MHRRTTRSGVRRGYPRTALAVAAGFALAAVAWLVVGVPAVVKYPTDLVATPSYEGTFTLLVDPVSAAPLTEPLELPLSVDRRIEAIGEESGATRVVVRETIEQRAGDLIDTTQTNQYVMDRSTLENVADDRAYAFEPGNVVDRSGAYRVNLPFGTGPDDSYPIYQNEIDDTYDMVPAGGDPAGEVEGLEVNWFTAEVTEAPVTDAYLDELGKAAALPRSLTVDQLAPHVAAAGDGVDLGGALAALAPALDPAGAATLAALTAEPVGLDYVLSFTGRAAIEPVTGAQVRVEVSEQLGARPDPGPLAALGDLLRRHPEVPGAVEAAAGLEALGTGPAIPVYAVDYAQTPASVAEVADTVAGLRDQVLLATVRLPLGLGAAAAGALLVGAAVAWRRRHRRIPPATVRPAPAPRPVPADQASVREPVGAGRRPG
ncbi:MAG TPA: porin PorA family protein [Acidimicrobiales bacterium]|nr:porin PorA family protein [Acidimicrobiales bacterium]